MSRRDVVLAVVAVAYCALFIAGHDLVSQAYGWLIDGLDKVVVEAFLYWGAVFSGLAGFGWLLVRRGRNWVFWGEGVLLGVLLWLSNTMLICTNVENIHYLQYAILGFLVRGLAGSDVGALLLANVIGMIDEWVQYVANPHYTKYLDFNDMILNMVGAMVGISLWCWLNHGRSQNKPARLWGSVVGVLYGTLAVAGLIGAATGRVVSFFPVETTPQTVLQEIGTKTVFVLSYVDTSAFYLTTGLGRTYHVMGPEEWAVVSCLLLGVAWGLSRLRRR